MVLRPLSIDSGPLQQREPPGSSVPLGQSLQPTAIRWLAAGVVSLGMTVSTLMAVAGSPTTGAAGGPDDRAMSAGRWNLVAVEWDGNPLDQEWLARLQVAYRADGSWTVFMRRIPVAEGTSTNRQDVSPKTFEMETLGSEGIEPKRYTGIYRLEGDTRVLCIVREGTPRPDGFTAPRRSNRMLVTMKRVQD